MRVLRSSAILALILLVFTDSVVSFAPPTSPAARAFFNPSVQSPVRCGTARAAGAASGVVAEEEIRAGVLLCNLGGPEVNEDVEGFLFNLFSDKDIIRLPKLLSFLQRPIAKVLSQRRAPQSRAAYQSIGGGSPIVRWTNAQASALEVSLAQRGLPGTRCYVAMRYWHPYTAQALEEIAADGINTLVVLPLYPQFSISTSGSSLRVLREELERAPHVAAGMVHTVIKSWHDRPGYIAAVARQCVDEVLKLPADALARGATTVLFSAHGVPQSYIAEGDPYQTQICECTALIEAQARLLLADTPAAAGADVAFELSYQSRVGPVEWLRPYTDDKIRDVARGGAESLVVVPISFVSEHIETLEEIDVEYREVAEAAGIRNWRRVPALGTDSRFIADLSAMVVEALVAPPLSVEEAVMDGERALAAAAAGRGESVLQRALGLPRRGGADAPPLPPLAPLPPQQREEQQRQRRRQLQQQGPQRRQLRPALCSSGASGGGGDACGGGVLGLSAMQVARAAERVAALSCFALLVDGCAREIVLNAQLPLLSTFTY